MPCREAQGLLCHSLAPHHYFGLFSVSAGWSLLDDLTLHSTHEKRLFLASWGRLCQGSYQKMRLEIPELPELVPGHSSYLQQSLRKEGTSSVFRRNVELNVLAGSCESL